MIIKTRNLSKQILFNKEKLDILSEINLEVNESSSIAITGPSGSGKSTLLSILAGLDLPSSGEIFLSTTHNQGHSLNKQWPKKFENVFKNAKSIKIDVTDLDSIFKNPVLICKLKPGEKLKFSAKSDIGISLTHARYASVGVCCYEYEEGKNNKFLFKMEPRGQIKSNEVILRGLRILSFKLETLKSKISKIKFTNENQGKIILNNEDHTIGNLIARGLQEHKNIEFAAYKLEHLLIRDLIIEYLTDGGKVINNILTDVISNYQKLFLELEKEISKLNFK